MRRQITRDETRRLLDRIRERVPNIALRTTFLVGFPGESDADFETLLDFVEEQRFDRVGVFQYSHEENTRAYALRDDVPPEVKVERAEQLMEIQREISLEKNTAKIGQSLKVLFDRREGGCFIGRTEADSPEVDNEVRVEAQTNYARVGDFASVHITAADAYDLHGTVLLEA